MPKLRAKTSFAAGIRVVRAGQIVDRADPVVSGRENLFTPVVEQATAAPGEIRAMPSAHVCGVCGFVAKTAGGLGAHKTSHGDA